MRESLFRLAQERFQVAKLVVGIALDDRILQFACDSQRGLETCTGRFRAPFVDIQEPKADERVALGALVSELARARQ